VVKSCSLLLHALNSILFTIPTTNFVAEYPRHRT
jgi:hypothetical protein